MMKRLVPFAFMLLMILALSAAAQAQPIQPDTQPREGEKPDTIVYLEPATQTMIPSDYVTVTVKIADVDRLFGLQLRILFDPQIVMVADANEAQQGVQILPGSFLFPFWEQENRANNATGVISLEGIMDVTSGGVPVSGSGELAVITFQGIGFGNTKIELEQVQLARGVSEAIPTEIGDPAYIYVLAKPLSNKVYLPLLLRNY